MKDAPVWAREDTLTTAQRKVYNRMEPGVKYNSRMLNTNHGTMLAIERLGLAWKHPWEQPGQVQNLGVTAFFERKYFS